jgi:glycosyltransferase involved in cell wall biosynthesis
MSYPLVSIICLCYNHERFIKEALDSVLAQTYPNIEIIIVDDSSTDSSVSFIREYCKAYPHIRFISTETNIGNCAAFNKGWHNTKGEFIIDFATDDILLPNRVEKQVAAFKQLDETYGVVYTDALYINDAGEPLQYHCKHDSKGKLISFAPSGDIFKELLLKYFICPPTMMMRRSVFEKLKGYDESLAYEDFDFWVRSSRYYKYYFLDTVTTQRRVHNASLSQGFYKPGNKLLRSTLQVCEKAVALVQTVKEKQALIKRLRYEARHAYLTNNYTEANQFLNLLKELKPLSISYRLLRYLNACKLDVSFIRRTYYNLRYRE